MAAPPAARPTGGQEEEQEQEGRRSRSRSRSRRSRSRAAKPGLNFACRKLTVFVLIERGTI